MTAMLIHAALLAATPLGATSPQEGWLAFTGCWHAENAPLTSLVCILPEGDGARLLEVENGEIRKESRVVADGQPRPISEQGCSGFESANWSADRERVLLTTELTCGDHTRRLTSGIFSFTTMNQWLSVQAVTVGKEGGARTTRYTEVPAAQLPATVAALLPGNQLARETARYAAVQPLDFKDVAEALARVEPRAVEALLIARGQPFDLSGKKLLALADAGTPEFIVDAMVAVSHPEIFEVRPSAPQSADRDPTARDLMDRDRFCDPYAYTPWSTSLDRYNCARYGYGYRMGSYGYGYTRSTPWGYYSPWDYYSTPVIVIRDGDPANQSFGGRAGRNGYSRGGSTGNAEHAVPRSERESASRPSTSGTRESSTSSASGSSSSSGESSGRTAKPRDK